jgi:hypothetical protein
VAAIKNEPESILKLKLGEIDLAKLISIMKVKKQIIDSFLFKKLLAKIDKIDLNNQFAIVDLLKVTGVEGAGF